MKSSNLYDRHHSFKFHQVTIYRDLLTNSVSFLPWNNLGADNRSGPNGDNQFHSKSSSHQFKIKSRSIKIESSPKDYLQSFGSSSSSRAIVLTILTSFKSERKTKQTDTGVASRHRSIQSIKSSNHLGKSSRLKTTLLTFISSRDYLSLQGRDFAFVLTTKSSTLLRRFRQLFLPWSPF